MKNVLSIRDLINKLTLTPTGEKRGNNFLTIVAKSSASSIRKNGEINGNPIVNIHYKKLVHLYTVRVQTGFDYQKRINKVRNANGEDHRNAESPVNGHRKIAPQVVQQRNGNIGLACEVLSFGHSEYRNTETNEIVTNEYLKPFKKETKTDIYYLTPNLLNIVSIAIDGSTFNVDASDYKDVCSDIGATFPFLDETEEMAMA